MIVNNVEEKIGFKNFDVLDQSTNIQFYEEVFFLQRMFPAYEETKMFLQGNIVAVNEDTFDNTNASKQFHFNKIDLRNNNKKLIVQISNAFYHKWMDNFFHIVAFLKKFPEGLIVLDYGFDNSFKEKDIFINFLLEYLNKNNFKYVFVQGRYLMAINNFYHVKTTTLSDVQINLIYDSVKYLIKDINKKPTKKVYISRKNSAQKRNTELLSNTLKENNWIDQNEYDLIGTNDVRIFEEDSLELYFKNLGFDIVYAENFKSIEETVNYFNDVHTLVAATSSAFVSSIFMQPGGKVVDLMIPYFPNDGGNTFLLTSYHFTGIIYAKKHLYVGIPSSIYGTKIVDYLNNNKNIIDFLTDDKHVY